MANDTDATQDQIKLWRSNTGATGSGGKPALVITPNSCDEAYAGFPGGCERHAKHKPVPAHQHPPVMPPLLGKTKVGKEKGGGGIVVA